MSLRQIRKLQKKAELENSEQHEQPKFTITTKQPRFSFSLLRESSETSDSSSEEEDEPTIKSNNQSLTEESDTSSESRDSDDSEWEKLLNETHESCEQTEYTSTSTFEHFLSSHPRHFRIKDVLESGKSRYLNRTAFRSGNRYWLCPSVSTKELIKLRLLASKQLDVSVELDPETGRDKFVMNLSDFFREIDDICSSAVNSQDFELFRRLMEMNPYHLGCLIRASCMNTISGKHQEAFSYLYLAVKILQTAMPTKFSIYRTNSSNMPNVWLPSNSGDNLLVYRLLLLYMIAFERKGQWQSSLAVCKLLIAMDFPCDVTHSLLHIDLYLLNSFDSNRSISTFCFDYYKLVNSELPPLFWFLPNFALTLALQLYLNQKGASRNLVEDIDVIRPHLMACLCLEDGPGLSFKPELDLDSHNALIDSLGDYAPYLLLLRALLQYPLFIVKMSEKIGSSPEIRSCAVEEPFASWKDIENEEYDYIDHQLVRCYTYKCGDVWSANNSTFLAQTANLVVNLYSDDDDRLLLESFQALWSAYVMDYSLPKHYQNVNIPEFDLANYSLPSELEFPL